MKTKRLLWFRIGNKVDYNGIILTINNVWYDDIINNWISTFDESEHKITQSVVKLYSYAQK